LYRKTKTHAIFNNFFENPAVYEIIWKNIVEPGRQHITMWLLRSSCWILKSTNTHSEYAIRINFQMRQCLCQHVSWDGLCTSLALSFVYEMFCCLSVCL